MAGTPPAGGGYGGRKLVVGRRGAARLPAQPIINAAGGPPAFNRVVQATSLVQWAARRPSSSVIIKTLIRYLPPVATAPVGGQFILFQPSVKRAVLRKEVRPVTILTQPTPTACQIVFDLASNSGLQTTVSSVSWTHTCAGSNRLLTVDVADADGSVGPSSATYAGIPMSFVGLRSIFSAASGSTLNLHSWVLANPPAGPHTVSVSSGTPATYMCGMAASYWNVHQKAPIESFNSNSASGGGFTTLPITPFTDECWLHAALCTDDTLVNAGTGLVGRTTTSHAGQEDTGKKISPPVLTQMPFNAGTQGWVTTGYAIRPSCGKFFPDIPLIVQARIWKPKGLVIIKRAGGPPSVNSLKVLQHESIHLAAVQPRKKNAVIIKTLIRYQPPPPQPPVSSSQYFVMDAVKEAVLRHRLYRVRPNVRPAKPVNIISTGTLPLVAKLNDNSSHRELVRFTEKISTIINSLIRRGYLKQSDVTEWFIDPNP